MGTSILALWGGRSCRPPEVCRRQATRSPAPQGRMKRSMRVALAQINPTIGDFPANTARIVRAAREAAARGADVVVFPELALTGYPPRDLVEKPSFLDRSESEIERVAQETADLGLSIICGFVARSQAETGKRALNSAALIERGQ